eukprot:scaffold10241_cov256-Chaetoceros_neogracile.AAC.24
MPSESSFTTIEVFLRVRPSKSPSGYFQQHDIDESQITVQVPKQSLDLTFNNLQNQYAFKFNGILDPKSKQDEVFRKIGAPAVRNVLQGLNSTVFAYGQTGSGKTFTITGGPERYADRGIIPRAISMLFASFQDDKLNATFNCSISYLELYNESGYDLLASNKGIEVTRLEDMPKVTMLEDDQGDYHFKNLSLNPIASEEEGLNFLFLGDTSRAIGETEMNQSSSRSHCIFTIHVEKRQHGTDTVIRSKLNLVDLAGSERVHKTHSTGQTLKEAQYINTSLFFLEMVIVALHEKSKKGKENTHIPYRNSMMTSVLRDSLGGNCKTLMIATISPDAKQTAESISTCHFAQRVALVENNAHINEELEPELVIQRLKDELKRVREEVRFLQGENGEGDDLTDEERLDLEQRIKSYALGEDNGELNIGAITLNKIQTTHSIFKELFKRQDKGHKKSFNNDTFVEEEGEDNVKNMQTQILSLQTTVLQRDEEIKLLVGMVKNREGGNISAFETQQRKSAIIPSVPPAHTSQVTVIDDKISGVLRCLEKQILRDPPQAFQWFRDRYPGEGSIEENKTVLQNRIREAKETGDIVKECRDEIINQKHQIEKIRRDIAIDQISGIERNIDDSNISVEKGITIIEKKKKMFKEALEKLRQLKVAIEHIKQLMENKRRKMQIDFDVWYAAMYDLLDNKPYLFLTHNNAISGTLEGECAAKQVATVEPGKQTMATITGETDVIPQPSFKLPQGVLLTGNIEADEDIIAFYRAKEVLLARAKGRG